MVKVRSVPTLVGTVACLLCSTAFTPLFDGFWWWFGPVLVASLAAMVAAAAGRALSLPLAAQAFVWLVGLTATITALCARDTAVAGILPTPATLRSLGTLLARGGEDIAQLAAPVPERPGLVTLIVIGMYSIVVIVDLLVVAAGRPTLAGLPLLGLFAVPAAILREGVGTAPFLLSAVGFLLLLFLDGRHSSGGWVRPAPSGRRPAPGRRPGSATLGGRVAITALAVAAVIPVTLPSLDGNGILERGLDSSAADTGPSTASVVQPIVSLEQQLHAKQTAELMTVDTASPQYLRMTALELFDGHRFTLREMRVTKDSRISEGLPGPPENIPVRPVQASIDVRPGFQQRLLPIPGIPTRVEGLAGDWRYVDATGTIFSTKTDTSSARYRVEAVVPTPEPADLRRELAATPNELQVATELPPNLDPRVGMLVEATTAEATTPYDKVVAIQNYLRGEDFQYDINGAPTYQDGALSAFLFDTKRGYCEQFASAMTVMVRKLGIPARVAVGFTYGTRQPDGTYIITNKDAHAWPEVWFPRSGWLRFEPTRRVDAGTSPPAYAVPAGDEPAIGQATTEPSPVPEPQPQPAGSPQPTPSGVAPTPPPAQEPSADGGGASADGGIGWLRLAGIAVGTLALATLLAAPAASRAVIRRRRLRVGGPSDTDGRAGERVHAAWAELTDVAADLGMQIRPSDSPRAGATRLGAYLDAEPEASRNVDHSRLGAGHAALARLARAEEHARYAPPGSPGPEAATAAADVATASATLRSVAPRTRRIRAAVAPPSVLSRVGWSVRATVQRRPQPGADVAADDMGAAAGWKPARPAAKAAKAAAKTATAGERQLVGPGRRR